MFLTPKPNAFTVSIANDYNQSIADAQRQFKISNQCIVVSASRSAKMIPPVSTHLNRDSCSPICRVQLFHCPRHWFLVTISSRPFSLRRELKSATCRIVTIFLGPTKILTFRLADTYLRVRLPTTTQGFIECNQIA
jgi:hypothetical protein